MTALIPLTIPTPTGDFVLLYDAATGAAHGGGFGSVESVETKLPRGTEIARDAKPGKESEPLREAVEAYFAGDLTALCAVRVDQSGGPFMQRCWEQMRALKPGETITYAELAARAGNSKAVRAAGSACGTNAVALVVPCHRILRTDGSLGGYQYGLRVKQWLLDFERSHARACSSS